MRLIGNTTHIRALRSVDRIALAIGLAFGLAGCSGKGPALVNPGVSRAPAANTSISRDVPDASPVWERIGELTDYRRMTREPFVSQGHFDGRWIADVFANNLAATPYVALPSATTLPQGSVVVQRHTERRGSTAGPVFAMIKREAGYFPAGGDWEYVVTLPDGRLEDRGQIQQCARCHAEGTSGWLFGLVPGAR
jgi:hypothetical protein